MLKTVSLIVFGLIWVVAGGCALFGLHTSTEPLQAVKYSTSFLTWLMVCFNLKRW